MNRPSSSIRGLYVITADLPQLGRSHVDVAKAALAGGARTIQLRDKAAASRRLLETANQIRRLTREAGALFIVNDRLDIALAAGADGVHLGDDDLPVETARKIGGDNLIIGASAGTVAEAQAARAAGADYLGVGCIFPTPSKDDAGVPLGPEIITQIKAAVDLPVIAIGGISADNATAVMTAGADGFAVISAVACADDMAAAARELAALIQDFS